MISSRWQLALDAAERAIGAAQGFLPSSELTRRRRDLTQERQQTAQLLSDVAQVARAPAVPWLSPVPVTAHMLGLPATARACVFDLEGVLTDAAFMHAQAWGVVFDDLLLRLSEKTHWHFIPFDSDADYYLYLDGRPRLEGIHAFLRSRGIRLPEGRSDDPVPLRHRIWSSHAQGRRACACVRQQGVTALSGARRYLEAAGHAGLKRAVISASSGTLPMLDLAGLATLLEERVDADVISAEGLRSRPAPDQLLHACRRLGVHPQEAITFTHSTAGVAAGRAAGLVTIGVGDEVRRELLSGYGAERVVAAVSDLLDLRLSEKPGIPNAPPWAH